MATSWIIDLVAESTDKAIIEGQSLFTSPECGVCGNKESDESVVGLYQKMNGHKCKSSIGSVFTVEGV
jgi:hypothetical protein